MFIITIVLAFNPFEASCQDQEPRNYANTPIGLNFILMGYGYTSGGIITDPALPIKDAQVELHSAVFAYARSLDVLGKSAKFNIVLPYAWATGSATADGNFRDRTISGLFDPAFRFSVNFYGAPALSMEEFPAYQQDTIIGASLNITAPAGQYDPDKLLNIGTNRWSIKPELGISKRLGPVTLELAGGIRFYTDNDNFFGGYVRKQDPVYSAQGHLIYNFGHGIWAAFDSTFFTGGQTTTNGLQEDNTLQNSRVGVTLALPINHANALKFYYSTGVSTRTGSDFDSIGMIWQYRFEGNLI